VFQQLDWRERAYETFLSTSALHIDILPLSAGTNNCKHGNAGRPMISLDSSACLHCGKRIRSTVEENSTDIMIIDEMRYLLNALGHPGLIAFNFQDMGKKKKKVCVDRAY
jgi:hypothetical protein